MRGAFRLICGLLLLAVAALTLWDVADARHQGMTANATRPAAKAPLRARPAAAPISAQAAIVVEASTGRVIYERNADRIMYPASLTKIMTCILALENSSLESRVPLVVGGEDADTWLKERGASVRLGDLLTEMMLISDNGAAIAVAEYLSGSVEKFAAWMTDRAHQLGATHTCFRNPNGLPDERHVTTARDLALLTRYAWRNPQFRRIVGTDKHLVCYAGTGEQAVLAETTNEMLDSYEGMCGVKTGWTQAAGGCFAGAATRNGVTLLSIVLHSEDVRARFDDTRQLLDDAFARVRMVRGPVKERLKRAVAVVDGNSRKLTAHPAVDIKYPLLDTERVKNYSFEVQMPDSVRAPILKGDQVGEVVIKYGGRDVGRVAMLADHDVAEPRDPVAVLLGWLASLLS